MTSARRSILELLFPQQEEVSLVPPARKTESTIELSNIENLEGPPEVSTTGKPEDTPSEELATGSTLLCSICLERLLGNQKVLVQTVCNHTFHRDCILTWMTEHHDDCPSCRYTPLYNVEKYNTLMADHPNASEETIPATTTPIQGAAPSTKLVYWVILLLVIQIGVMSIFIYGPSSRSSSEQKEEEEVPFQLTNLTISCENVTIPFENFSTRELFCTKQSRSCTVCASMSLDQCSCFCREEVGASGILYYSASQCCRCTK